jgi:hypothetical protein
MRPLTYHKFLKKKKKGLLIIWSSSYNTPVLAVHKRPNKWRLVQDLWLINEAVIPLHPIAPNPYTPLAEIPSKLNILCTRFKRCFLLHSSAS